MPVRQTPLTIAASLLGTMLLASCSPAAEDYGHRVLLAPYEDAERWKHTSVPIYPKSDRDEIVRMLEEAANAGDYRAMASLGAMEEPRPGENWQAAHARAFAMIKTAADHGDALGQTNLGILYLGRWLDVPQNFVEAVRLFRLAADKQFALAEACLGRMYYVGAGGLEENKDEAKRLFRLAQEHGEPLATAYLDGRF